MIKHKVKNSIPFMASIFTEYLFPVSILLINQVSLHQCRTIPTRSKGFDSHLPILKSTLPERKPLTHTIIILCLL